MAVVCTISPEQHKSWPPTPPRFESSRLHDLNHLTLRFSHHRVDDGQHSTSPVFVSVGCCTRHSTPATTLVHIRFISFHILSLVNPSFRCQQRLTQSKRVSLPPSSPPWLVVTTAISLRCDDIFQHPAVVPCNGSQQSHSGAQVFSLALQLRDRCVSSTSLLLLQILVHRTPTLLTTRP